MWNKILSVGNKDNDLRGMLDPAGVDEGGVRNTEALVVAMCRLPAVLDWAKQMETDSQTRIVDHAAYAAKENKGFREVHFIGGAIALHGRALKALEGSNQSVDNTARGTGERCGCCHLLRGALTMQRLPIAAYPALIWGGNLNPTEHSHI